MTKQDKRARWMSAYEDELLKMRPEMRGKIDWDTATYFYTRGMSPVGAATTHAIDHPMDGGV